MKRVLIYSLIFSILACASSLVMKTNICSSGFFSLYQGACYNFLGWPIAYIRIYQDSGIKVEPKLLMFNMAFWFTLVTSLFALLFVLKNLLAKK